MIIEGKLNEIFVQLPEIDGFKPVYHFGDELEFNKFVLKNNGKVYPLIWQLIKKEVDNDYAERTSTDLEFFIAVRNTETDMFNTIRWETSYKNVLNPMYDNIKKALKESGIIKSNWSFEKFKRPNYSQSENKDKNKTIDIIDVIEVSLRDVEIKDSCVNTITF
jgi:hypothetical protein